MNGSSLVQAPGSKESGSLPRAFLSPLPAEPEACTVDVVVPVCGQPDLTRAFLRSLAQETAHPFRLILVENGSSDLGEDVLHGFADILHLRLPENRGYAGGCNAGIAAGRNPLVCLVNNDLLFLAGWLRRLVRILVEDPSVAAAAPSTNYAAGDQAVEIGSFRDETEMRLRARAFTDRNRGRVEDVESATGLCLLLRRDVLERIGLLDERFGQGNFEDNDLCLRIKRAGLRIVLARDSFVFHLGNRTFQALQIDYDRLLARNRAIFEEKWRDDPWIQGRAREQAGDLEGALRVYGEAMKKGHPDPEILFRAGAVLLDLGRWEGAARAFRQYLSACPEATRARIGLGIAQCRAGRYAEGLFLLRSVLHHHYLNEEDRTQLKRYIAGLIPCPCASGATITAADEERET